MHTIPLGPLDTNAYVLSDERGGACLVDPGLWPQRLLDFLRGQDLRVNLVLLTHGHGDHIAGVPDVRQAYPHAEVVCPRADAPMLADPRKNLSAMLGFPVRVDPPDLLVDPGDLLTAAGDQCVVLDTAGHTPGGVSYYLPRRGIVLTGDALFAGGVGRTDIPGGDAARLLSNIRSRLFGLPDETIVLPGHGPASTVGREKASNPLG